MRLRAFDSTVSKTLSFAAIHLAIAVTLGWLFTGAFILGSMLPSSNRRPTRSWPTGWKNSRHGFVATPVGAPS
jgi:hypothetical protein